MKQNSRFQANSYFTEHFILETKLMVTEDSTRMKQFKRQRNRVGNQEMWVD